MSQFNTFQTTAIRIFNSVGRLYGLALAVLIAVAAIFLRQISDIAVLSPMLMAVLVGTAVGQLWKPSELMRPGLALAMRPVLRAGIVLMGLQLTLGQMVELGPAALAIAAVSLGLTYVTMMFLGRLLRIPTALVTLISAGTAVCGASAVIAANAVARGTEEDVTYSVACITLFGTLSMLALPVGAVLMGMEAELFGIWVGASVHEVAQVTAAAFQMGEAAGQAGTVTKLVRVILLAPVIIVMALAARRSAAEGMGKVSFPWFVVGFIIMILVNSTVSIPSTLHDAAAFITALFLSVGLAAMGMQTNLARLRATGSRALILAAFGSIFVASVALVLIHLAYY